MKRVTWVLGIMIAVGVATAIAQPPGGLGGPGGPGGRGGPGGPGGMRPPPVMEVLDADHDHVISADELKNATASLLTLDKNNDGKLTADEFGPPQGGPGAGRGQGGAAPGNRAGNGANGRRPQSGAQGGPNGQGGPGGPGGPNGPGGRGPGGGPPGGPGEGPNPERMVDHAMQFDANKDGKLSRDELLKFADDFTKNHPGPGGPGGAGPNDGDRPERPRRPEE